MKFIRPALKLVILLLVIVTYISATLLWSQAKAIHPDALNFTKIFQDQYDTITSIGDAPRAIWSALNICNQYDLNRGRLTNCVAFGLEALIRGYLPFPFISWMTMLVLLVNAFLLACLVTKHVRPSSKRMTLFCLSTLLIILNPMFVASYEMQFTYSKYLCITFVLLFLLSSNRPLKIFFLACAMFSDEIGVLFCIGVAFLAAYNLRFKYGQRIDKAEENRVHVRVRDSLIIGVCASFSALLLYYGVLAFAFDIVPYTPFIGVLLLMVVAFLAAYNLRFRYGQSMDNAEENRVHVRARDSLIIAVCASFSALLLYYGALAFAFHTVPYTAFIKGYLLGGHPVSLLGPSQWLLRTVGYGFSACLLWPSNAGIHNTSTCQVNTFAAVFLLLVLLYVLMASRDRIVSALKWFCNVAAQRPIWHLQRVITAPDFQLYGGAVFLVLFINYGMYRGGASDYSYYPYPILMLATFLFLSLLFKVLNGRTASIVLVVLIASLALQLPRNLDSIGLRVKMEWLSDGSISTEAFDQIDRAVMELRRDGVSEAFEQVNNHQEFSICCYRYSNEYFPVTGMIRVLIWPRKLPDE